MTQWREDRGPLGALSSSSALATSARAAGHPFLGPLASRHGVMTRGTWWCFYDGDCHLCQGVVARYGMRMRKLGGRCCSLQASPLAKHWDYDLLMREMRVWDGHHLHGGAQAIAWILGRVWFLCPLPWLCRLPILGHIAAAGYGWLARNRHCFGGACVLPTQPPAQ